MVKNAHSILRIKEFQTRLWGVKWFMKLNLCQGYNLVRIKEGEEWKTVFRIWKKYWEYIVMPFELTNVLATFQAMINNTLRTMLNWFAIIYLDDIAIYFKTMKKHVAHVKKVLKVLASRSLWLKTSKYKFHKEEIEYLGYIVGKKRIKMNPEKIQKIMEWPMPTIIKKVLSFIKLANFNW